MPEYLCPLKGKQIQNEGTKKLTNTFINAFLGSRIYAKEYSGIKAYRLDAGYQICG